MPEPVTSQLQSTMSKLLDAQKAVSRSARARREAGTIEADETTIDAEISIDPAITQDAPATQLEIAGAQDSTVGGFENFRAQA